MQGDGITDRYSKLNTRPRCVGQHVMGDDQRGHPVGLVLSGLPSDGLLFPLWMATSEATRADLKGLQQCRRTGHGVATTPARSLGGPCGYADSPVRPSTRQGLFDHTLSVPVKK